MVQSFYIETNISYLSGKNCIVKELTSFMKLLKRCGCSHKMTIVPFSNIDFE